MPFGAIFFPHKSLYWETIKHAFGVTTEVMEKCIPEKERSKCRWSARSHVFIWVVTILVGLVSAVRIRQEDSEKITPETSSTDAKETMRS